MSQIAVVTLNFRHTLRSCKNIFMSILRPSLEQVWEKVFKKNSEIRDAQMGLKQGGVSNGVYF